MISDIDEIPNPKKIIEFDLKEKYACLLQKNFQSKLNLLNITNNYWPGTKICQKKFLKSPQWLRNIKTKKVPFWKFFKDKEPQLINDAGWHFSFLKTPPLIRKKIISYSHQEFNKEEFINEENIEKKINKGEDLFNRNIKYKAIAVDKSFPKYIFKNKEYFKNWII
jgi:beta-1,4-mannosyl-glycoprotein beta-1,4-N-acetylglucosaminyltransferase